MFRVHNIRLSRVCLVFLLIAYPAFFSDAAQKIFIPDQIHSRIRIHNGPIITGSDSLIFRDRLLTRDKDYRIDYLEGFIFLNISGQSGDTLYVHYVPLPSWLKKYYGIRPETVSEPMPRAVIVEVEPAAIGQSSRSSTINLNGAKKFSILTQTGGSSQFSQSLELTIKGELSPGLEISGSVADRGYDPSYGTINSQISELDKLNLKIKSKRFYSELGSLDILQPSDFGGSAVKRVSGIQASYHDRRLAASALFARPRGQFQTAKLYGNDRMQGPYRVLAGSQISAIVPGSEQVWLNGGMLERGADKDYIMDYPSGSITFTPRVPIDSRSRIEIDFEPLTVEYQKEMYQVSAGVSSSDSLAHFRIGFTREGDDRERLEVGELSPQDISLLDSIGDSVSQNYRSGIVTETAGDYVERQDSSGYKYYEYVGIGQGDYRVSFSAVGVGKGDYLYEGNNVYRFVGRGQAEFMPLISVPVPAKEDFLDAELGWKPFSQSSVDLIVRQSNFDKNLYSKRNDNNNIGGQYIASVSIGQLPALNSGRFGLSGSLNIINRNFKPRNRLNRPDLERKYLIPRNLTPLGDQRELAVSSLAPIPGPYKLYVSSGLFNYARQFTSYFGALSVYPDVENSLWPFLTYTRLEGEYDTCGMKLKGRNDQIGGSISHRFSPNLVITTRANYDRRWNRYMNILRGTTERQYEAALAFRDIKLEIQHYAEDTLIVSWRNALIRRRGILNLTHQLGGLKGEIYFILQRLKRDASVENQLMTRLNLSYIPIRTNLSINSSFALSDENRFERGLRYIEVEPGEGRFIYSDGQYIPDPNGNYIEIEEIHSAQASVKRGEKSFALSYIPSALYLKIVSNISEELLSIGRRNLLWMIPFYSDGSQPYMQRRLYYQGDVKLFRYADYYLVNLAATYNLESRKIGTSDFDRFEKQVKISFNEATGPWRYIQEVTYFEYLRDSYFSSPGNIKGYSIQLSVLRSFQKGQWNNSFEYRFAEDDNKSRSKLYILTINPRLRLFAGGETSLRLEGYRQALSAVGIVSYRLTDNYYGEKGINWSVRSDYRLTQDLRFSISFDGRHSDDYKPRVYGRGGLIANF